MTGLHGRGLPIGAVPIVRVSAVAGVPAPHARAGMPAMRAAQILQAQPCARVAPA